MLDIAADVIQLRSEPHIRDDWTCPFDQPRRSCGLTCMPCGSRRCDQSARPRLGVGAELGGALEGGSSRGVPAPQPRPLGRVLEFLGDVGVRAYGRGSAMPGALVSLLIAAERVCEGKVRGPPRARRRPW